MKKILYALIYPLLFTLMIILVKPQVEASGVTSNNVYTYATFTGTNFGVSLNITQNNTFTVNGTATNSVQFNLPILHAPNSVGSSINQNKYYAYVYEYISGTATFANGNNTISNNTVITDAQVIGSQTLNLTATNYQGKAGFLIIPENTTYHLVRFASGTILTNLTFKIHIIEVENPLQNEVNFFTSGGSRTLGSANVAVTQPSTIVVNGQLAASSSAVLDSFVNPLLINSSNIYLFITEYVSGTIGGSFSYPISPLSFNNDSRLGTLQSQASSNYLRGYLGSSITSFAVTSNASQLLTSYTYRIIVKEIQLTSGSAHIPGESTTPPTGVMLSGSTFTDMIYFNDASNNLLTSNPSVYIATTTGNTFDTNLLTDNLVFVVNQPNIRFYIGHSNGGDDNLSGVGDYVIYKDATFIYIKKLVDDIEVDEIYIGLSDFSFLMIETIPDVNPQTWIVTFDANGGNSVTSQTINHNELAVEPNNPTRMGYTFNGWLLNDVPFNFTTPITQNVTLTAHWLSADPNLVSISFNSNGGTSVQTVQIASGTTLNELSTSTRPGYIFMGWYTDAGLTQMFTLSTVLDNDLTLYAKWLPLSGGGEPIIDDGSNTYNWVYIVVAGLLVSALFIKPKSKKGNGR